MFTKRITNQNFCSDFILSVCVFEFFVTKNMFSDSLTSSFYSFLLFNGRTRKNSKKKKVERKKETKNKDTENKKKRKNKKKRSYRSYQSGTNRGDRCFARLFMRSSEWTSVTARKAKFVIKSRVVPRYRFHLSN